MSNLIRLTELKREHSENVRLLPDSELNSLGEGNIISLMPRPNVSELELMFHVKITKVKGIKVTGIIIKGLKNSNDYNVSKEIKFSKTEVIKMKV